MFWQVFHVSRLSLLRSHRVAGDGYLAQRGTDNGMNISQQHFFLTCEANFM